MNRFVLQLSSVSPSGTFFSIRRRADEHEVGAAVIRAGRTQILEVVHPSPVNKVDGEFMRGGDAELIAWLSDVAAVNLALSSLEVSSVAQVGWVEWVRVSRQPIAAIF